MLLQSISGMHSMFLIMFLPAMCYTKQLPTLSPEDDFLCNPTRCYAFEIHNSESNTFLVLDQMRLSCSSLRDAVTSHMPFGCQIIKNHTPFGCQHAAIDCVAPLAQTGPYSTVWFRRGSGFGMRVRFQFEIWNASPH